MNLTILPPGMGKLFGRLVWPLVKEKENFEFRPVKLLKIDLVLHPAYV